MEDGAEKLTFEQIFTKIKERVIQETEIVLSHKKSMKIKMGVKFEAAKRDIDLFEDDGLSSGKATTSESGKTKADSTGITDVIWSLDPTTCTKANMKTVIDEQYSKLNKNSRIHTMLWEDQDGLFSDGIIYLLNV